MTSRFHHSPFFDRGSARNSITGILEAASRVRIATAYFEISGWRTLQKALVGKRLDLLVGRPDTLPDRIRSVLLEFLEELQNASGPGRSSDFFHLREALSAGNLVVSVSGDSPAGTLDARYIHHHAKLYIGDEDELVLTSANFTANGLLLSREAGITIADSPTVSFFVEKFDEYFSSGEDISSALLEILNQFLENRSPYEVYIRSLLEYYGLSESEDPGRLPEPASYQVPVISAILRNLEELGGSFLIASTGLGKTVMAAHAISRLRSRGLIDSVILFCPAGLKSMWKRTLRAARVSDRVFSYHNLSSDDWKKYRSTEYLIEELKYADEKTLVLLDESHHLRNESVPGESLRLRNRRVKEAVEKGAKVLLLTATPYSRGIEDINAQLALLPAILLREGDLIQDGTTESWRIQEPGQLRDLPPAVVLTAPTVVRHFSQDDGKGSRYVLFSGDRRMFFPHRIHVKNRPYRNPVDPLIQELFSEGLLHRRSEDEQLLFAASGKRDPLLEARLVHQFCSSTGEAIRVCRQMEREGGFENIRFQQQEQLTALIKKNETFLSTFESGKTDETGRHPDEKITVVLEILKNHSADKIVIFCYYHETARYLRDALRRALPGEGVEHTLDRDGESLERLLRDFAPEANEVGHLSGESEPIDPDREIRILIATGALSEGFNLQDAPVLINFDLPWTVLVLAQRMGRILRPWMEPRDVHVYNMIPSTMESLEKGGFRLAGRWKDRLLKRSKDHTSFARIPVLMDREESLEVFQLGEAMREIGDADLQLEEALEFLERADRYTSSSFIDDMANLDSNEVRRIRKIPAGFRSRVSARRTGMIYVLFQWKGRPYPTLFSPAEKLQKEIRPEEIFQKIRIAIDSPSVDPLPERWEEEDEILDRLRDSWAEEKSIPVHEVTILCSLFVE